MASVQKTYGNLEGDGAYDFRLGSFSPMPKIPAGAKLTSLTYDCKARRNWGSSGANGKVEVDAGGTLITVISGMKYNTDYDPGPVELINYVRPYADGTILFLNGSDELHVEVQHNTSLLGTSWWKITENVITAYYEEPRAIVTVVGGRHTVSSGDGARQYSYNELIKLYNTGKSGYYYCDGWECSNGKTYTVEQLTNGLPVKDLITAYETYLTFTAIYKPITGTLTLKVYPEGAGTTTGAGVYDKNTTTSVEITANANPGWRFVRWERDDGYIHEWPDCTVGISGTYTAIFEKVIDSILIDSVKPSGILIDTSAVKELYIDTTKVWG